MTAVFHDRADAGRRLGEALVDRIHGDAVVCALSRSALPIALEAARALNAALDLTLVRKIGAPDAPGKMLAAVVGGPRPRTIIHEDVASRVRAAPDYLERARAVALAEILAEGSQGLDLRGHVAVLVDDGVRTGATARAAAAGLAAQGARRTVLAAPVGPAAVLAALREELDEVICLRETAAPGTISDAYTEFPEVSEVEVSACLEAARA